MHFIICICCILCLCRLGTEDAASVNPCSSSCKPVDIRIERSTAKGIHSAFLTYDGFIKFQSGQNPVYQPLVVMTPVGAAKKWHQLKSDTSTNRKLEKTFDEHGKPVVVEMLEVQALIAL